MSSYLFVHSPLLGPSSLRRLAGLVSDHDVALPDLTGALVGSDPHTGYVRAAAGAVTGSAHAVVIGHSGAGPFLPGIRAALGTPALLVFVDAIVPPASGSHLPPPEVTALLDAQTDGGILRPWLDWWPADVLDRVLPQVADRLRLREDMPGVPRSFYDDPVDVPEGWAKTGCAYVQLSGAYDADRARAAEWGWPTLSLDRDHLAVHTSPQEVCSAISAVVDELDSG